MLKTENGVLTLHGLPRSRGLRSFLNGRCATSRERRDVVVHLPAAYAYIIAPCAAFLNGPAMPLCLH